MSEEAWKKVASKLTFCHGTSSKFLNSILKYGILPRKTDGIRPSVYSGHLESKHIDSVYLSRWEDSIPGFCLIAARNAAEKFGGEPVVVNVKLDPDDFDRLLRDEDSYLDDYRGLYKQACEFYKETGKSAACFDSAIIKVLNEAVKEGILKEEDICNPPKWFAEIACFGRFALKDGVKPSKLTGVKREEEIMKLVEMMLKD